MVLELQWKLAFKSLSGRHDASIQALLQHATVPVIGAHHPKQDPILEDEDKTGIRHTGALSVCVRAPFIHTHEQTHVQCVCGEADLRHLHVEGALVVTKSA